MIVWRLAKIFALVVAIVVICASFAVAEFYRVISPALSAAIIMGVVIAAFGGLFQVLKETRHP